MTCRKCGISRKNWLLKQTFCPIGSPIVTTGKTIQAKMVKNTTGQSLNPGKVVSMESEKPEVVFVSGRTFWDFLAEMETPKLRIGKRVLQITGIALLLLLIVGCLFLASWYDEFGTEWAKAAVKLTCKLVAILSSFGAFGLFAFTVEGWKK